MSNAIAKSLSDNPAYTGVWINWSHGRIQGAVLTLTHRDGGLLTAFLALFVTVVATSFWRLFCFTAHFKLSAGLSPQDGLYHQRQAAFRNATTELAGLRYFIYMALAWRRNTQSLWRIVPFIGITCILMVAFWVASIFSSQVATTTGDEVLVSNARCGTIAGFNFPRLEDYYKDFVPYSNELAVASAAYAQQCYSGDNTTGSGECLGYVKSGLPMTIYSNASCPFPGGNKICLKETGNLHIDTGIIDSHKQLGVNAAPVNRFGMQFNLKCAPLRTEGFTRTQEGGDTMSQDGNLEYLYGGRITKYGDTNSSSRVTYEYPIRGQIFPNEETDFIVGTVRNEAGKMFAPISELNATKPGEVVFLVFVSANGVNYIEKVDDEVFSAHQPAPPLQDINELNQGDIPVYHADQPTGVLGCVTRLDLWNPHKNLSTPLMLVDTEERVAKTLLLNDRQFNTMDILLTAWEGMDCTVQGTLSNPVTTSLLVRNKLSSTRVGPLPSDQWQKEVAHWQATSLARLQRSLLEQFTGPSDPSVESYVNTTRTADQQALCKMQKIRSSAYTSFSVLGLSLTLVLGSFIILLSLLIDRLLVFTQRWHRYGVFQRLEWISNETLQLQRMAHEELGCGTWTGAEKKVPVTAKDEMLALLNVEDQAHPSLARATSPVLGKEDKQEIGISDLDGKECGLTASPSQKSYNTEIDNASQNGYNVSAINKDAGVAVVHVIESPTDSQASTSPIESCH